MESERSESGEFYGKSKGEYEGDFMGRVMKSFKESNW